MKLILEKRKHVGAVNCMIYAEGCVYTGGDDFQIFCWDPVGMNVVHQLYGSLNHVRTIVYDSGRLFSSGDDRIVRCWDLETHLEVSEGWPILAHNDSVRTLAAGGGMLYTGGKDGYVKKFNAETAETIHEFNIGTGGVKDLFVLQNSGQLLVGTNSGIIVVLDVDTFEPIGEIREHRNTLFNLFVPLCRVSASKFWIIGSDGICRVHYTESDSVNPEYNMNPEEHQELQNKIKEMRTTIMENDEELQKRRDQLSALRVMDSVQKEVVRDSLAGINKRSLHREYFEKLLNWLRIKRNLRHRRELCELLVEHSDKYLRVGYFSKWSRCTAFEKRRRQRTQIAEGLLKTTNKDLQSLYLRNCISYTNRMDRQRKRRDTAVYLLKTTNRGALIGYFANWRRWQVRMYNLRKRESIAAALLKNSENAMLTIYYRKILDFFYLYQNLKKREITAEFLASSTHRYHMLSVYQRLLKFRRAKINEKERLEACCVMLTNTSYGLRRSTYNRLANNIGWKKRNHLQNKNNALANKIAELREMVEGESLPLEEIEAHTVKTEIDIENIRKDSHELDHHQEVLKGQRNELDRELQKAVRINPNGATSDQVDQVMKILKPHGVKCGAHNHHKIIQTVKEQEKLDKKKPSATLIAGMNRIRGVIKEATGQKLVPGEEYPLAGGVLSTLNPKQKTGATTGAREMVVAWDCMKQRKHDPAELTEVNMKEIVENSHWLEAIIMLDSPIEVVEVVRKASKLTFLIPQEVYLNTATLMRIRMLDDEGKLCEANERIEFRNGGAGGSVTGVVRKSKTMDSETQGEGDAEPEPEPKTELQVFGGECAESVTFEHLGTHNLEAAFETISGTTTVKVVPVPALRTSLSGPRRLATGDKGIITVEAVDLDDKPVPAQGTVTIRTNDKPEQEVEMKDGFTSAVVPLPADGKLDIEAKLGDTKSYKTIVVEPMAPVSRLVVEAPPSAKAGALFEVNITLADAEGNVVPEAEGTVIVKGIESNSKSVEVHKDGKAKVHVSSKIGGAQVFEALYKDQAISSEFTVNILGGAKGKASPRTKAASPRATGGVPFLGMEVNDDCSVKSVAKGAPADKVGITTEDTIVEVEGMPVVSLKDFTETVKDKMVVGNKLRMRVKNADGVREAPLIVGSRPAKKAERSVAKGASTKGSPKKSAKSSPAKADKPSPKKASPAKGAKGSPKKGAKGSPKKGAKGSPKKGKASPAKGAKGSPKKGKASPAKGAKGSPKKGASSKSDKGYLGMEVQDDCDVQSVQKNSPGDKAGFVSDKDRIVEVDGIPVVNLEDFGAAVKHKLIVGTEINFKVKCDDIVRDVKLIVEARPPKKASK